MVLRVPAATEQLTWMTTADGCSGGADREWSDADPVVGDHDDGARLELIADEVEDLSHGRRLVRGCVHGPTKEDDARKSGVRSGQQLTEVGIGRYEDA